MLNKFIFATGIENSYPTIQLPHGSILRVDEMEKANHTNYGNKISGLLKIWEYSFYATGRPIILRILGRVSMTGVLRMKTFKQLKELGIIPFVDLCHFDVLDWVTNF